MLLLRKNNVYAIIAEVSGKYIPAIDRGEWQRGCGGTGRHPGLKICGVYQWGDVGVTATTAEVIPTKMWRRVTQPGEYQTGIEICIRTGPTTPM